MECLALDSFTYRYLKSLFCFLSGVWWAIWSVEYVVPTPDVGILLTHTRMTERVEHIIIPSFFVSSLLMMEGPPSKRSGEKRFCKRACNVMHQNKHSTLAFSF